MSLEPGARLGAYEVVALLGAGGMGEVYKARDTRLNRTVAIKVLPEHLRDNPDLKQRFEREAQAVAALEHPHICVLHDIGHEKGIDFLVMEYLQGETLAQRLARGLPFLPMPSFWRTSPARRAPSSFTCVPWRGSRRRPFRAALEPWNPSFPPMASG